MEFDNKPAGYETAVAMDDRGERMLSEILGESNKDIKEAIRNLHVPQWKVARAMGVSENTLNRWLRLPLEKNRRAIICTVIDRMRRELGVGLGERPSNH